MAPEQQSQSSQSTQIPVPTSLTSDTTSLPPLTSHLLISHLRQTNAIADLSALLTDSLARTGWTDRVRALALELLRNGSCDTFPELLEEVLRRCKVPSGGDEGGSGSGGGNKREGGRSGGKSIPNGTGGAGANSQSGGPTSAPGSQANGVGSITVREGWFGPDGLPDVRVPQKTVDGAVEFLRERIQDCVEPVDDD